MKTPVAGHPLPQGGEGKADLGAYALFPQGGEGWNLLQGFSLRTPGCPPAGGKPALSGITGTRRTHMASQTEDVTTGQSPISNQNSPIPNQQSPIANEQSPI